MALAPEYPAQNTPHVPSIVDLPGDYRPMDILDVFRIKHELAEQVYGIRLKPAIAMMGGVKPGEYFERSTLETAVGIAKRLLQEREYLLRQIAELKRTKEAAPKDA